LTWNFFTIIWVWNFLIKTVWLLIVVVCSTKNMNIKKGAVWNWYKIFYFNSIFNFFLFQQISLFYIQCKSLCCKMHLLRLSRERGFLKMSKTFRTYKTKTFCAIWVGNKYTFLYKLFPSCKSIIIKLAKMWLNFASKFKWRNI